MNEPNYVSVVIPSYNRAGMLKECLEALERLDYPRDHFEIIVVNDGSSDNTESLLDTFSRKTSLDFSFLNQINKGPASARNRGWKSAKYEWIAFTDDDCVVDPQWLKALPEGFLSEEYGAVGGLIKTQFQGLISDYMDFHTIIKSDLSNNRFPPFVITANACYRKKVLEQTQGFDEKLLHPGGEDPDLSWRAARAGYKMGYSKNAIVRHASNRKFLDFLRSFYFYANGHAYLVHKHGLKGECASLWEDIKKTRVLSPITFLYRIKLYIKEHKLGVMKSALFSVLDTLRQIAALAGYWSYREVSVPVKKNRGEDVFDD